MIPQRLWLSNDRRVLRTVRDMKERTYDTNVVEEESPLLVSLTTNDSPVCSAA